MSGRATGLAAWQESFAGAVLEPASPAQDQLLAELLDELVPGGTLDAEGALDVYRRGYPVRLIEQLCETFEGVWWILGDEEFLATCRDFIAGHRSVSYNLSDYGREFPAFLARSRHAADAPFLGELADFELAFTDLFHCAEHDHVDAQSLAANPDAAALSLEFGAAMFLRRHASSVHRLWRLRKGSQRAAGDLDWSAEERILGYKLGGEVFLRELDEPSFAALEALAGGSTLGDALASVAARHPSFDARAVGELFGGVFQTGIVSALGR